MSSIANTASVSGQAPTDPVSSNNSSEVTITVATLADVSITESGPVSVTTGASTDLHPDRQQRRSLRCPERAGQRRAAHRAEQRAVLHLRRAGRRLPGDDRLERLDQLEQPAAGATTKVKISADVPADVADGSVLSNFATAASSTDDDDTTDNTSNTVATTVETLADLSITRPTAPTRSSPAPT